MGIPVCSYQAGFLTSSSDIKAGFTGASKTISPALIHSSSLRSDKNSWVQTSDSLGPLILLDRRSSDRHGRFDFHASFFRAVPGAGRREGLSVDFRSADKPV